jgi:hypothetical protein
MNNITKYKIAESNNSLGSWEIESENDEFDLDEIDVEAAL